MKIFHVIFGVLTVLALWYILGFWIPSNITGYENPGVFGDQFGAVNSFFSGLAFAGVIYAVVLQSKELKLQREELEQTRAVLRDQKLQLEEQNKTMQQQRFENTFFQMLSLQNEIVNSLDWNNRKGRAVVNEIRLQLEGWRGKNDKFCKVPNSRAFFNNYIKYLDRYFENLKVALKIIEASSVVEKAFYAEILIAQLSNDELVMTFYYCLEEANYPLKQLAEKYTLFNRISDAGLPFKDDKELFEESAFVAKAV